MNTTGDCSMSNPVLTLLATCAACGEQFCAVLREGDRLPRVCGPCAKDAVKRNKEAERGE